jgi:two-component system, response regulator, stage 0 sporulation protein F
MMSLVERPQVLVVDDEPGMRETRQDILEDAGYDVMAASDGPTAIESLRQRPADVVVMDVRMPGPDGVAVFEAMGAPPPQVILMTAYALDERLRRAMDGGAFAVIHKPFPAPYLLNLVEQAAAS